LINLELGQISTSRENLKVSGGSSLTIAKYSFIFQPWTDSHNYDTYAGKQVLKLNNEPLFSELVLLRLLERQSFKGVWVDTYRNKFWQRLPHISFPVLPDNKLLDVYEEIYNLKGGKKSGCFDIIAYRGSDFVFVELKKKNEDSIRQTQLDWLSAAMQVTTIKSTFIIAEWEVGD